MEGGGKRSERSCQERDCDSDDLDWNFDAQQSSQGPFKRRRNTSLQLIGLDDDRKGTLKDVVQGLSSWFDGKSVIVGQFITENER